jgi:hypothetical protein
LETGVLSAPIKPAILAASVRHRLGPQGNAI